MKNESVGDAGSLREEKGERLHRQYKTVRSGSTPGGCAALQSNLGRWRNGPINAEPCAWEGITPGTRTSWLLTGWKAALRECPGGPGGHQVEHEAAVCLLRQRRPRVSWTALGRTLPTDQGRWSCLFVHTSETYLEGWVTAGLPSARETWTCWSESSHKGHKDDEGTGASDVGGEAQRAGTTQPGEEEAQGYAISVYKYLMEEARHNQTLLSGDLWKNKRRWPQTEIQEIPLKHKKQLFYCEDRLPREISASGWCLHSCRCSKPNGTWSWATCCRWPCFEQGRGISRAASQPQPLSILWLLLSLRQNFACFQQGKFDLQMFLTLSEFLPETGVPSFLLGAIIIYPCSLNESFYILSAGMVGKTESSVLFINVWLSLYPFWKSAVLCMLTVLLDILPMGKNVTFFLSSWINSWPQQELLGQEVPEMCCINTKYIPYKNSESRCDGSCKDLLGFFKKRDTKPWEGGGLWFDRHGYPTLDRRVRSRETDSSSLSFQRRCCSGFI